jgi:hypothetical protein
MPVDPNAPGGNEAQGQEEEVFTREQVGELMAEHDRRWQARLTPLHQERAELRRANARYEGRLDALEKTIQSRGNAASPNGRDEDDGVDWKALAGDAADELRRAIDKRFEWHGRRSTRPEPAAERGDGLSPTEERMEAYLLNQEEEKVRSVYRGMTEDEMRQILELGISTGNGDLKYLAFELYGSPEEWKRGRGGADEGGSRTGGGRTPQSVLAGRARAQGAARSQEIVEIPGGMAGYRAADKIAEKFLKSQGHT